MTDNELEELFPQFACIADGSLRQKAQRAMRLAAQRGGWDWESILKCPVTLNWTECPVTWVEHVRDVTDACIQAFAQQENISGKTMCRLAGIWWWQGRCCMILGN